MSEMINVVTLVASLGLLVALIARESKQSNIVRQKSESEEKSI